MPEQSPDEQKRDNSTVLREIVQTFSDEAQVAATKKATELGFSLDRGSIPFQETLINLRGDRDLLVSAIDEGALPQLPLKIQNQLIADARRVSTQLTQLTNGTDSLLPLEAAVDDLTATIWHSNLQNMSGEILGFQKKQNQLKTLETTLRGLARDAESFKAKEAAAQQSLAQIEAASVQASSLGEGIRKYAEEISQRATATKDAEQQANASVAVVQQEQTSIAQSAASSRTTSADLESQKTKGESIVRELDDIREKYAALTKAITEFTTSTEIEIRATQEKQKLEYQTLDKQLQGERERLTKLVTESTTGLTTTINSTLETSITQFDTEKKALISKLETAETTREQKAAVALRKSSDDFNKELGTIKEETQKTHDATTIRSNTLITENEQKTKERFEELLKLEDVIREKILLATNYQLFHAFQTRQLAIAEGKDFWRNALFTLVGVSFLLAVAFITYLFMAHPAYDASFYLKLSISFPLVYAIHFCSTEYSKERKLEEEYAFKGNISISLEPYRELVEKMIDKNDTAEAAKYSDFVISTIEKVFTSPTPQILGKKEEKATSDEISDTSKGITKILGSMNDLIQSIAKFK